MLKFKKQDFIALLSFSGSLARVAKISNRTKYISLNNEPCLARTTVIEINPNKLHHFPFMFSLHSCKGSCNTFDDL